VKDSTRTAALLAGGYVLGRTKKGGLALRTFMWATGNTGGPQAIGRARGALQGEAAQALIQQVSGPLRQAMQDAAMAAVQQRMQGLTTSLTDRTAKLTGPVGDAVNDTVDTATKPLSKRRKGKQDDQPEDEAEQPDSDDGEDTDDQPEDDGDPDRDGDGDGDDHPEGDQGDDEDRERHDG
jgi:hypothetical protein